MSDELKPSAIRELKATLAHIEQLADGLRDRIAYLKGKPNLVAERPQGQDYYSGEVDRKLVDSIVKHRLSQPAQPAAVPEWKHKRRGTTYSEICRAELQCDPHTYPREGDTLVVYRGEDGKPWCRLVSEFSDGRFERIAASPSPPIAAAGQDDARDAERWRFIAANRWRAVDILDALPGGELAHEISTTSAIDAAIRKSKESGV